MAHVRCLSIGLLLAAMLASCGARSATNADRRDCLRDGGNRDAHAAGRVAIGQGPQHRAGGAQRNQRSPPRADAPGRDGRGRPGKRAALGKALKAELLVFLAGVAKPKPHVLVVVCETQQGLRLCSEPLVSSGKVEDDADAVHKLVETAAKKRQEKIVDIVAVPPLVNSSLTHEADQFQGAFARLVEQDLLRRPGVLVVETGRGEGVGPGNRNQRVRQRHRTTIAAVLAGRVPHRERGQGSPGGVLLAVVAGRQGTRSPAREGPRREESSDRLHRAAAELVEKALGKGATRPDLEAEVRRLTLGRRSSSRWAVGTRPWRWLKRACS